MFTTVYMLVLVTVMNSQVEVAIPQSYTTAAPCQAQVKAISLDYSRLKTSFRRHAFCTAVRINSQGERNEPAAN